jgi:hypothetical protein
LPERLQGTVEIGETRPEQLGVDSARLDLSLQGSPEVPKRQLHLPDLHRRVAQGRLNREGIELADHAVGRRRHVAQHAGSIDARAHREHRRLIVQRHGARIGIERPSAHGRRFGPLRPGAGDERGNGRDDGGANRIHGHTVVEDAVGAGDAVAVGTGVTELAELVRGAGLVVVVVVVVVVVLEVEVDVFVGVLVVDVFVGALVVEDVDVDVEVRVGA